MQKNDHYHTVEVTEIQTFSSQGIIKKQSQNSDSGSSSPENYTISAKTSFLSIPIHSIPGIC